MSDNELKDYQPVKAIVNKPLQWTDLALSEQVKTLRFFRDKDNNILAMPVVFFDPTQTGLNVLPMGRVGISDPGALNSYARVFGLPCCGWPEATLGLVTHSTKMVQKDLNLEAQRTPVIFRFSTANNPGNTAAWTPAAGLRFRLLGIKLFLGAAALGAAGYETIELRDNAVVLQRWLLYLPNAVATGVIYLDQTIDLPSNGYLSVAANNPLNVNLSAALTVGNVCGMTWGTEEV